MLAEVAWCNIVWILFIHQIGGRPLHVLHLILSRRAERQVCFLDLNRGGKRSQDEMQVSERSPSRVPMIMRGETADLRICPCYQMPWQRTKKGADIDRRQVDNI